MGNENIDLLFGDYKVGMRKMMLPMILGMLITQSYNLIDGIWVSFLGPNALAALGVTTPLYSVLNAFAFGLAAGGTSLISRYIGAKNHEKANQSATQSIVLTVLVSIFITAFMLIFQRNILLLIGGASIIDTAVDYNTIIFLGTFFIMLMSMLSGILRAEGDMNRSLYIMALSSIMNVILDPILMFYFNLNVQGAALSTVLSSIVPCVIIFYWIVIKQDSYSKIKRKYLKIDLGIMKELLSVGLPASLETLCIAIQLAFINAVLANLISTNAVAVYTSGMRVVLFGIVPGVGMKLVTVTMTGAAYGAKMFKRIKDIFYYGTKIGIYMGLGIGVLIFIFAPNIALLFSYSPETNVLVPDITLMLRLMLLFFLSQPIGGMCSGYFQGLGKGFNSFLTTLLQELVCPILFVLILIQLFTPSLSLVIIGVVCGKISGAVISWLYSNFKCDKDISNFGENGELIKKVNT